MSKSCFPTTNDSGNSGLQISRHCLVPWLERTTLAYLLLPNLLFLLGWLKWFFALPATAALICAFFWSWKRSKLWDSTEWKPKLGPVKLRPLVILGVLGVAAFWTWASGVGGYQFFTGDWEKHFSLLKSLQLDSWPPTEHPVGRDYHWPICYYVGYYLPAAVVGKLLGWQASCLALYLWSVAGVFLSLIWLALLVGKRPLLAVLIFPFLGGLDWFGQVLWAGSAPPGREHLEWWAGWITWEYSSNQTLMSWVPQHAIPCWLVFGWIMHEWLERRNLARAGLLAGLLPIWAPMVFLGLIPFAILGVVSQRIRTVAEWVEDHQTLASKVLHRLPGVFQRAMLPFLALVGLTLDKVRPTLTLGNLAGIIPAAFASLYLAGHVAPVPHGIHWELIWIGPHSWSNMAFFLLIEAALFAFFTDELYRPTLPLLRRLGFVALIVLFLIPHYNIGKLNDFSMRASQPALFVLWVLVLRSLLNHPFPRSRSMLALLVILGSFGSFGGWVFATDTPGGRHPPSEDQVSLLYGIEWPYAQQYYGNPESFFFRHLSKEFRAGPHVPVLPTPPGMWMTPEEAAAPPGYPQGEGPAKNP